MKKPLQWPDYKDEKAVSAWLDATDFSEYLEPSDLKPANIAELIEQSKPKTKPVTIRLPENWIMKAKALSAHMNMPYQTLMKQFIRKGLEV